MSATPTRLRLAAAALVLGCLLTLVAGLVSGGVRGDAVGAGGTRLAQLDYDASEVYDALNGANASAATGLGSDRTSSPTMLARYDSYVTSAFLRLDHARGLLGTDGPDAAAVETIAYALPRYTTSVDTARALRDQDPARARTELDDAAGLMGATILPTADRLQRDQRAALTDDLGRAAAFPVLVVLLGVLVLVSLAVVSVREARRTKRVLNVGLVAAGVLTVLALAWWLIATFVAAGHLDTARAHNDGAADLGAVRVATLQARAAETAPGGASPALAGDLDGVLRPGGRLDAAGSAPGSDRVRGAVAAWQQALRQHGPGSDESRVAFVGLTETTDGAIADEQGERTTAVEDAAGALTGIAVGSAVLMGLAAVAVALGLRPRLREYRA